ncbi:MAG: flagellar FliJ family protein, partial [Methylococcaceae bacterium]|nr:flagellar FliJ family protein [Methylococcaceae bacterium]
MKKSERLKTVADIKASQANKAMETWGLAQRKYSDLLKQVDGLKVYRSEYQNNFNRLGGGGVKVAQLLEYRSFIEKLDKAILGQEQALAM